MKIQKITALLGALALSIGFASSAAALSVNLGTGVDVQANVGGSASDNTNLSASTSNQASVSATNVNTNTNANANASANLAPVFETQADVSAGMVAPTSDNAASVQTNSDLSGYVAARLQDDSNISQIQASGSNVAVTYQEPVKILGIFPTNVEATATVGSNGSVDVSYPWYAFLFKTDASNLQSQIEARVNADLGASANASTGLSAQEQAKLVGDVSSVMQAQANASASATTNVQ